MNRLVSSVCFAIAALAASTRADAAVSPQLAVCAVRQDPSTTYGTFGAVVLSLKSTHAQCSDSGVPVQAAYFCSKQAINANCTSVVGFHYSELGIQGIYQSSVQALVNERFVEIFSETSTTTKGQQLRLY